MAKKKHKKKWNLKSLEGKVFNFYPVWGIKDIPEGQINVNDKDVECVQVILEYDGKQHTFNYLDLFMFMYFTANEELRQNLIARQERKVHEIPYDVSFNLSEDEKQAGKAKRRITLTVDELTMAVARNEALKLQANEWMKKLKK